MTNFKTIDETKKEMRKVAEYAQVEIGDFLNIVQAIANGKDPEKEISIYDKYGLTFDGWADRVRNSLGLLWEYRQDIESMRSKEGFTIMADPEDKKTHEFISENLEDEK